MPDQKLCNTHRLRSVNIQQKPLTLPEVCVLSACCPRLGNSVSSPDTPNDLESKWSAMEWIYTVGLGCCLMHLLHNGYRKATIIFISELTKFTSNARTSSCVCSRRSHYIMWTFHTNSTWKDPSWMEGNTLGSKNIEPAFGQLRWVIHFSFSQYCGVIYSETLLIIYIRSERHLETLRWHLKEP